MEMAAAHVLEDIVLGIRRILQGNEWAPAFDGNGYGCQQRCVRARIHEEMECASVSDVPEGLPTLSDIESISPVGAPLICLCYSMEFALRKETHTPRLSLSPPALHLLQGRRRRRMSPHGLAVFAALADYLSRSTWFEIPTRRCPRQPILHRHVCPSSRQ